LYLRTHANIFRKELAMSGGLLKCHGAFSERN
jgi:hypothetical protein